MVSAPSGNGHWEVDQFGDAVTDGDATCTGSLAGSTLDPVAGLTDRYPSMR